MNTHPFASEDVMAYLDGELTPRVAAETAAHLAQCRSCQETAADLQGVSRQLAGWTTESPETAEIPTSISAALSVSKPRQPAPVWNWFFAHPILMTVPVALVLVIIASLFRTANRPRSMGADAPKVLQSSVSEGHIANKYFLRPEQEDAALVVRTAELRLTASNFDSVRVDLDRILLQFGGHIAQLDVASPSGEARSLTASLRIPAPRLDAALAELRRLGRVDGESQRGEEVTQQSVDLEARLANARNTEQRLTEILRSRTGKLSDVLEVEEKLAQVRGQIERAEAERKSLNNRVSFATVSLKVNEEYHAPLAAPGVSLETRLGNAAVDGIRSAFNGIVLITEDLLEAGPSLFALALLLGLPAYFLWKKFRR